MPKGVGLQQPASVVPCCSGMRGGHLHWGTPALWDTDYTWTSSEGDWWPTPLYTGENIRDQFSCSWTTKKELCDAWAAGLSLFSLRPSREQHRNRVWTLILFWWYFEPLCFAFPGFLLRCGVCQIQPRMAMECCTVNALLLPLLALGGVFEDGWDKPWNSCAAVD